VQQVLDIFQRAGVNDWALELKNRYIEKAMQHLDEIAVLSKRKEPLRQLAGFLVQREH
jgi:geranylgeranyl diphosphate synthase type II